MIIALMFLLGAISICKAGSTGLGQGFYLPKVPLIQDNGSGKTMFTTIPPECIEAIPSDLNRVEKTFYGSTKSFYTKLGVETSLSDEVSVGFTLGASLIVASNAIDSQTLDVKGISMDVYAMTGFWEIHPDCLVNMTLDEDFVKAFTSLPSKIDDPRKSSSWYEYDTVLSTYGSHITKRVSHGSKLTHYVFSKYKEDVSSKEFLIKVCMAVKNVNLTYCSKFTASDYAKVTHLATSEDITVRGGSAETRAKLMKNITAELMEQFMLEAHLTEQPISAQYISVWDILKSRYLGTEHYIKAINMESYYLGMLNTGCTHEVDQGNELRRFVLVDDNSNAPGYQCQLSPMGCKVNKDCNFEGVPWSACYCYGNSCINKKSIVDPRHTLTENRYVKKSPDGTSYNEGINLSCSYHIGISCRCDELWAGSWKTVWPSSHVSGERSFSIALPLLAAVAMLLL